MSGKKRILLSLLLFVVIFIAGVMGFKLFGGKEWSILDSLYMTVITFSTVGYKEVVDIDANTGARIFAVVFIVFCLGTITFVISSITAFVVGGDLRNILWRKKMDKEISRLNGHYIVCGADDTAMTIIRELTLTDKKFVVIEPQKEKIDKLAASGNILYIQDDPTEDHILQQAKIDRAAGILLSLPKDEENLFVALSARSLNPGIRIVTKGIDVKSHEKMMKAGADAVVSPSFIGGMRMVSEMIRPQVVSFLDMMLRERKEVLRFEEVSVGTVSPLIGKTISESKIGEKTGALLVAIKDEESEEYNFNPAEETKIKENDVLILIASPEMTAEVKKIAG